jgi:hypothetical protein
MVASLAGLMVNASVALAQVQCWTSSASTGTVDETDTSKVAYNGPSAVIKNAATLPANLHIRYNIVAVDGLFGGDNIAMTVRYRDNGGQAKILAKVQEMNLTTGTITTQMTFDSNTFAQSADVQTQTITTEAFSGSFFDFLTNIYYIEAQIIKTGENGTPLLQGMQVCFSLS